MTTASDNSARILESSALGMRMEIIQSTAETGGAVFESRNTVAPGFTGPPLHIHPNSEETFQVLSGTLDVCVGKEWRQLTAGQSAAVPAGVAHTLKNSGATEAQFLIAYRPALRIEDFFREMIALANSGQVTFPPKGPRAVLLASMLAAAYPETNRGVSPPPGVVKLLAGIARLLGYKLPA